MVPIISMFLGIIIRMQYNDHNPPHFHAEYQDYKAVYDFDGNLLAGDMPRKQRRFIEAWCELSRDELLADWEACREQAEPFRIDPLRRG